MVAVYLCEECLWNDKAWNDNQSPIGPGVCSRCGKTVDVKKFPRTQFADIAPVKPKPRPIQTDWDMLKAEFIANSDYKLVRSWLRDIKGFSDAKLDAGETQEKITGWGVERAETRQTILEQSKQAAREKLADMIPDLYLSKQKILEKLTAKLDSSLDIDEFIDILKVIKTELGEPTTVSKQQITTDDTIDEALEELRHAVSSSREGTNAGGGATVATAAAAEPDSI